MDVVGAVDAVDADADVGRADFAAPREVRLLVVAAIDAAGVVDVGMTILPPFFFDGSVVTDSVAAAEISVQVADVVSVDAADADPAATATAMAAAVVKIVANT